MKIQLTPSELISQSSEMSSLQGEYEALFGRVNSTLNSVNDSWSANLANNFAGKISSAQKSFSNMTALLSQGASVAAQSARTMENVDKLLSSTISNLSLDETSSNSRTNGRTAGFAESLSEDLNEDIKTTGELIDKFEEEYEKIPLWLRKNLEKVIGDDAVTVLKTTFDIISGDADWDTLEGFLETAGADKEVLSATGPTLRYVFSEKFREFEDRSVAYEDISIEALYNGEYLKSLEYLGKELLVGFEEIGYGVGEVFTELASDFLRKANDMATSITDTAGHLVSWIPGCEEIGEIIVESTDYVGTAIYTICDWLHGLL